jgi:hypothetical protein
MKPLLLASMILVVFIIGVGVGAPSFTGGSVKRRTTSTTTVTLSGRASVSGVCGPVLLNFSRTGDADSQPFTSSQSAGEVTVAIASTAANQSSSVKWYIYPASVASGYGSSGYVASGDVNGQSGSSNTFVYTLAPTASYYTSIVSANADWQIIVSACGYLLPPASP